MSVDFQKYLNSELGPRNDLERPRNFGTQKEIKVSFQNLGFQFFIISVIFSEPSLLLPESSLFFARCVSFPATFSILFTIHFSSFSSFSHLLKTPQLFTILIVFPSEIPLSPSVSSPHSHPPKKRFSTPPSSHISVSSASFSSLFFSKKSVEKQQ